MLDPLMTSDMQNVAEAFIGDHARVGALVLEDGVGRGRRRVEDEIDLAGLAPRRGEQTLDAPSSRRSTDLRGVVGTLLMAIAPVSRSE